MNALPSFQMMLIYTVMKNKPRLTAVVIFFLYKLFFISTCLSVIFEN